MDWQNSRTIQQRYEMVLEQIDISARKSGRNPREVGLVVVTKRHPVEKIRELIQAGARVLGENYADEGALKINALSEFPEVQWHMIGHVQSRKAGIVASQFAYLHSLDRVKLAEKLDRSSAERNNRFPVLLEFNVSGEMNKSGFAAQDERSLDKQLPEIEKILACPNIDVRGLMTMPPYFDEPERARSYFRKLRHYQSFLRTTFPHLEWNELSMGMSNDYQIAIEEGATWIRIGTSIMGPRPEI